MTAAEARAQLDAELDARGFDRAGIPHDAFESMAAVVADMVLVGKASARQGAEAMIRAHELARAQATEAECLANMRALGHRHARERRDH